MSPQSPPASADRAAAAVRPAGGSGEWYDWPDPDLVPHHAVGRIRAWLKAHPTTMDTLLALAVSALNGLTLVGLAQNGTIAARSPWIAVGAVLLGGVPVALRRRATWPAVWLTGIYFLLAVVMPTTVTNSGLSVFVVGYTAAARLAFRPALLATAAIWLPALLLLPVVGDAEELSLTLPVFYVVLFNLLTALVCFFIGRTVHNRRRYTAALEERARAAELNQAALTAQAVAEERRRIARELHDVVAHHVSVMSVLATGSRRMLNRDPRAADEALATIEETGRTALREMRRLLSVLRADTEPAGELAPQPGLSAVTNLVEQVREAGLPVTIRVDGQPGPMDPGVALTVYRIVQEALTNALKHAGVATAEVHLSFGTDSLEVEVCDTGRGPQLSSIVVGHGLLGMRERVMLYGGTLRTGPRPGGGYRLSAKIPVEALDGASTPSVGSSA